MRGTHPTPSCQAGSVKRHILYGGPGQLGWSGLLVTPLDSHIARGGSFSQIGPMRTITPYRLPIKHRSAFLGGGRVTSLPRLLITPSVMGKT